MQQFADNPSSMEDIPIRFGGGPGFLQVVCRVLMVLIAVPALGFGRTADKVVIAHRGASGYLPEHTLAAKAMAHAMGADLLEQDLVMTKDDRIIVVHDLHLDRVTNVQQVFPNRHRKDGRYYAIDFTLEEIRSLRVFERYKMVDGKRTPVYPDRFPLGKSRFSLHTFEEEIEMIQGLNRSTGRTVGLYPEIKQPAFHLKEGKDLSKSVLRTLKKYGYTEKNAGLYLQVFDFGEIKRLHDDLLPSMQMDINLIFLVNGGMKYRWVSEEGGMERVARYADGLGPSMDMIVSKSSKPGAPVISGFVKSAHRAGLVVHPYTFRIEKEAIPGYAKDFADLLDIFFHKAEVDGVFTDFPDRAVRFLEGSQ
jgi:glycerophosphoryl diester phosphodiesterase